VKESDGESERKKKRGRGSLERNSLVTDAGSERARGRVGKGAGDRDYESE